MLTFSEYAIGCPSNITCDTDYFHCLALDEGCQENRCPIYYLYKILQEGKDWTNALRRNAKVLRDKLLEDTDYIGEGEVEQGIGDWTVNPART